MSGLFVGCRVRVVQVLSPVGQPYLGCVGVITEIDDDCSPTLYGLDIRPILHGRDESGKWARGFHAYQLEPVIPEGHQPATQSHEQLMADLRKGVIHA